MELAGLVLEYIKVFIWPITIFVVIFLFHNQIRDILSRVKKADLPGGISIETFPEKIEEAKKMSIEVKEEKDMDVRSHKKPTIPLTDANARMLNLGLAPSPSGLNISYYKELSDEDPNLALAGIRIEAETMLKNLAKGFKIPINAKDGAGSIASKLKARGDVTSRQYDLIMIIIKICNAAVHGLKVTVAQAEEILNIFKVLTDEYISWLSWGFSKEREYGDVSERGTTR